MTNQQSSSQHNSHHYWTVLGQLVLRTGSGSQGSEVRGQGSLVLTFLGPGASPSPKDDLFPSDFERPLLMVFTCWGPRHCVVSPERQLEAGNAVSEQTVS